MTAATVYMPTRIHLLWHGWALPTENTASLRRETVALLGEYLGYHYPHAEVVVSFDEALDRSIEFHMDFAYGALSELDRQAHQVMWEKDLSALVGDVMRYFVARDSYNRMLLSRNRINADHDRYGLGTGHDSIPWPPRREEHMPRFPLEFDKTWDGSRIYEGGIGPGENPFAR